jgi:hypothetical protein
MNRVLNVILALFLCTLFIGCGTRAYFMTEADESYDFTNHKVIMIYPSQKMTIMDKNIGKDLVKLLTKKGYKITGSLAEADLILQFVTNQENWELTGYSPQTSNTHISGQLGKKNVYVNSTSTEWSEYKYDENTTTIFIRLSKDGSADYAVWDGIVAIPTLKYDQNREKLLSGLINKIGKTIKTDYLLK